MRVLLIVVALLALTASADACPWTLYAMVQDGTAPWPGYWWKGIEVFTLKDTPGKHPSMEACRKKVLESTGRQRIHMIGWYPVSKIRSTNPEWVKQAIELAGDHALFIGCLPSDYDPYEARE